MNVMIEGDFDIFWENNSDRAATRMYRVSFLPYFGSEHGAVPFKQFRGDEALFGYLADLQDPCMADERRKRRAQQWMLELRGKTTLSLPNMMLTEKQASEFSRAALAAT